MEIDPLVLSEHLLPFAGSSLALIEEHDLGGKTSSLESVAVAPQ